jgi:hypothetical protein
MVVMGTRPKHLFSHTKLEANKLEACLNFLLEVS